MDEVQEAAIVQANLEALADEATAEEVLQATTGYSDAAVQIALHRTAGAGGGGGQTLQVTVTAAEIAARWDSGKSYIQVDDIQPGDCCIVIVHTEDTLDGDTTPGLLVAYEPDATTSDVDGGNDQLADVAGSFTPSTYSSGGLFPTTTPYAFLNEGAAAYIQYQGTAPPTTGHVTTAILRSA